MVGTRQVRRGALLVACLSLFLVAGTVLARGRPSPTPRIAATLAGLKVISYYPTGGGWTYMWTRWHPATIDADFARIAGLRANTVRVFVFPGVFGFPQPHPYMQQRLAQLIDRAAAHGLRVQLTLFDWMHPYGRIDDSKAWAQAILRPYAGDRRIAFIELQNEIDPANGAAMRWTRSLLPWVRQAAGGLPVTVSVKRVAPDLARLRGALAGAEPDFFTLHYYGAAQLAYAAFRQAESAVHGAPLFIGETGRSVSSIETDGCTVAGTRLRESLQDLYLRTVEYAAHAAGLPPAAVWTLNDFRGGAIPGSSATARPAEYHYGLFRLDGSPRPAAATIRQLFSGRGVAVSLNGSFEQNDGSLPDGWLVYHSCEGQFGVDSAVAHSGRFSLQLSRTTGDARGWPSLYTYPVNAIVHPGANYSLSAYARGAALTGQTRVVLSWFDAAGRWLGATSSADLPPGTTGWRLLTANGPAPAGAAAVLIYLSSSDNSGAAWFDDVRFSSHGRG